MSPFQIPSRMSSPSLLLHKVGCYYISRRLQNSRWHYYRFPEQKIDTLHNFPSAAGYHHQGNQEYNHPLSGSQCRHPKSKRIILLCILPPYQQFTQKSLHNSFTFCLRNMQFVLAFSGKKGYTLLRRGRKQLFFRKSGDGSVFPLFLQVS